MTTNEIKKALYKQNPSAILEFIINDKIHYYADLIEERVKFEIPFNDTKEATFLATMEAKYLIRWLK